MADFYPGSDTTYLGRDHGHPGGAMSGNDPPRGTLHITAGGSFAGSLSVYLGQGYWPTATASFESGRFQIWSHLSVHNSAYTLRHTDPTATNGMGSAHPQIELVWTNEDTVQDMPRAYLDGIAAWMRWVESETGIPRVGYSPWATGTTWHRMSNDEWSRWSGWHGHMHVPQQDHVDPGRGFDIGYVIDNQEADVLTPDQDRALSELLVRVKHIESMVPSAANEAATRDAAEQALIKALPSGVTGTVDTAAVAALVVSAIGSKLANQGGNA